VNRGEAVQSTISVPRLAGGIALFVLVGFPLVAYLWETLNQLMGGEVRPLRLLLTLPVVLLLTGVLRLLSRAVRRWEAERVEHAHAGERHSSP
jgi:hypothetical protein